MVSVDSDILRKRCSYFSYLLVTTSTISINKHHSHHVCLCAASCKDQCYVQALLESHIYRNTFQDEPHSSEWKPGNTGARVFVVCSELMHKLNCVVSTPTLLVTSAVRILVVLCGLISVDDCLLMENQRFKKGHRARSQ